MKKPKLTAKCISCGNKEEVKAGEVPTGTMPMCDKCGSIMLIEKVEIK